MPLLPPWAPQLPDAPEDSEEPPEEVEADEAAPDDAPEIDPEQDVDGNATDDAHHAVEAVDDGRTGTLADPFPWNVPRRAMNRLAGSAYTGERARREVAGVIRGVVRALGGARGATRRAVAGRATAGRFAMFLSTAATRGLAEAARIFRIDGFLGSSVEVFLERLVAALAPDGALTEDAVALAATADTVDDLFDALGVAEEGLGALDHLTPDAVVTALRLYIANYVMRRALQALSSRIEERALTPERAVDIERQVHDYVHDTVAFELDGRDPTTVDWASAEGRALVARIFEDAFALLQAAEEAS